MRVCMHPCVRVQCVWGKVGRKGGKEEEWEYLSAIHVCNCAIGVLHGRKLNESDTTCGAILVAKQFGGDDASARLQGTNWKNDLSYNRRLIDPYI